MSYLLQHSQTSPHMLSTPPSQAFNYHHYSSSRSATGQAALISHKNLNRTEVNEVSPVRSGTKFQNALVQSEDKLLQ